MNETGTNPKLKSEIKFFPFGEHLYHVYDPTTRRHFKLGSEEVSWLKLLDGSSSPEMLRGRIPEQYFDAFFAQLRRMSLLEGEKPKTKFDLFKIKFPLLDPNEKLDRIKDKATTYRQVLDIFFPFLLVVNGLLLVLQWDHMQRSLLSVRFSWKMVVFYLAAVSVIGLVHELSHALVAKSFGVNVTAIGVMLFYFQPSFYADVSGINLLASPGPRINVLLAGLKANNLFVTVALFAYSLAPHSSAATYIVIFLYMNVLFCLINLVPFVEYDGYYALSELIGEPGFATHARRNILTRGKKKIEYILYFVLSQLFALAIVFLALTWLRRLAFRLTRGEWINYATLALMIAAVFFLARRTLRRA